MGQRTFVSSSVIRQWIRSGLERTSIEQKLRAEGFGEEHIVEYLEAFQKAKSRQRQEKGFMLAGIGAVLGFISCVLTLTNPFPELFHVILYGLTSVAVLIIFAGLYLVFE